MAHGVLYRGRLVAAMHHAIGALFVVARPVCVPVGLVHQLAKARGIAFAQQVARSLPAKDVARRIAPRRATIVAVAGEEVEKQPRLTERPRAPVASAPEDVAKEPLRPGARQEVLLIRRTLVRVARRYGDAVDAELVNPIEKARDALGIGIVEQRAIDVDAKAARLRGTDGGDSPIVNAVFTHRAVVHLAIAIEMHRPNEVRAR